MKILYTNFHGGNGGGHDTYICNLAVGMTGRAHDVTIASPDGSRLSFMVGKLCNADIVPMQFKPKLRRILREILMLRSLINEKRFDVVHVNGSADHRLVMLATLCMRRRPAIVFTKHNTYSANSFGNYLRAKLATDVTIAVSDYVRVMLEKSSPYEKIIVLKHGVPGYGKKFESAKIRNLRNQYFGDIGADVIILGSVAGTAPHKGWTDLVDALNRLPEEYRKKFRVILAGDLPTDAQRKFVEHAGMASQIVFAGRIDCSRDVLEIAHVSFVLSYHESLSYACREAMWMGCPVIVTNVGGLPENIFDRLDGWIVRPRDSEEIAGILCEIADRPEIIKVMGKRAQFKARGEYCFDKFLGGVELIYEDAVNRLSLDERASVQSL
ncbi:glycosyltransferase [Burkholderia sp. RS02]|uniref:glycosyltransferase n=1 Tax=unclassified Burkholderia TaxID=2613784 RepID=UPI003218C8B8